LHFVAFLWSAAAGDGEIVCLLNDKHKPIVCLF
jgi:hypothetical protein